MKFIPSAFCSDKLYLTVGDILRLLFFGSLEEGALKIFRGEVPDKQTSR